jgi:hypothetical protein
MTTSPAPGRQGPLGGPFEALAGETPWSAKAGHLVARGGRARYAATGGLT